MIEADRPSRGRLPLQAAGLFFCLQMVGKEIERSEF
jgi:hypothetical protein